MATFDVVCQARHLAHAECGLHVGHAEIEAQRHLLVVPGAMRGLGHKGWVARDAMAAQLAQPGRKFGAVGHCHTAFGSGDDLDGMEAKDGNVAVAPVANGFAFVLAADGVRGVFDDFEAIFLAQRVDGCHVARLACQVHGNDDFGQPVSLR